MKVLSTASEGESNFSGGRQRRVVKSTMDYRGELMKVNAYERQFRTIQTEMLAFLHGYSTGASPQYVISERLTLRLSLLLSERLTPFWAKIEKVDELLFTRREYPVLLTGRYLLMSR